VALSTQRVGGGRRDAAGFLAGQDDPVRESIPMPRLVHLTRASNIRAIQRAGIRGEPSSVLVDPTRSVCIERAVFAMPLVSDFAVTYQWLRELRRWHGQRMVAVHIRLPSTEEVLVGQYNAIHERRSLGQAIRRLLDEPTGSEIVVPRSVRRREVTVIREVTQLVGWTEQPTQPGATSMDECVCQVCLRSGIPDFMRRIRGAFERHVMGARKAKASRDVVDRLHYLSVPLERAKGRIPPTKLLAFTRHSDEDVRGAAAALLGSFRWKQVEDALVRLIADGDERVRLTAIESMVRAGGLRRASNHAILGSSDVLARFVGNLEYEPDTKTAASVLASVAFRASGEGGALVAAVAARLLIEDDLGVDTRRVLEDLRCRSTTPSPNAIRTEEEGVMPVTTTSLEAR
jgi:hypothetical protein